MPLEMPQPVQRVERRLPWPRRYADGLARLNDERVGHVVFGRIEDVRRGVEAHVRKSAPIELGEERPEPVRVFVVERDRLHGCPGVGRR